MNTLIFKIKMGPGDKTRTSHKSKVIYKIKTNYKK